MRIGGGMVALDLEGRLLRFSMVAVPFEEEEELAVRNPLNLRSSMPKGWLQVPLPQVVSLPDMTIDINDPHETLSS